MTAFLTVQKLLNGEIFMQWYFTIIVRKKVFSAMLPSLLHYSGDRSSSWSTVNKWYKEFQLGGTRFCRTEIPCITCELWCMEALRPLVVHQLTEEQGRGGWIGASTRFEHLMEAGQSGSGTSSWLTRLLYSSLRNKPFCIRKRLDVLLSGNWNNSAFLYSCI